MVLHVQYNKLQINWVLGVEWGRSKEEIHSIRLCGIQLSRMLLTHMLFKQITQCESDARAGILFRCYEEWMSNVQQRCLEHL